MKKLLCLLPAMLVSVMPLAARSYVVKSPDKAYELKVNAGEGSTSYSVHYKGRTIINSSAIGLVDADGGVIGAGTVTSAKKSSHKGRGNKPRNDDGKI